MNKLVIASNNPGKLREFERMLADEVQLGLVHRFGIGFQAVG